MLDVNRIDGSGGIDVDKTSATKECDICNYWYSLIYSLNFNQLSAIDFMIY